MSATELIREVQSLPQEKRADFAADVLRALYPESEQKIRGVLRRLEHPDVPDSFWEAIDEAARGQAIEVRDEHFERPPG